MQLLFVCTGNICRSAVAERLTTAFVEQLGRTDLAARSAGVDAVVGSTMHPRSADALRQLGGTVGDFRARQFTVELAESADLVLTMTRAQRRAVLQVAPRALARTFTLLEAADLLQSLPAGLVLPRAEDLAARGPALVTALARQRSARVLVSHAEDDVPDPVRRSSRRHVEVADLIADALFPLLQELTGIRVPVPV